MFKLIIVLLAALAAMFMMYACSPSVGNTAFVVNGHTFSWAIVGGIVFCIIAYKVLDD